MSAISVWPQPARQTASLPAKRCTWAIWFRSTRWNESTSRACWRGRLPSRRPRESWTSTRRRCSGSARNMAWRDRLTVRGRLSVRFVVAAGLLVCPTVTAGVWTFFALTRLSGIVTDTVRQSESVTAVTSRLAGALEREDDAVLLILAGDDRGTEVLARERTVVDRAMSDLFEVLGPDDERELANPLRAALSAYR